MPNWNYIHNAATPDERDEITALLLQRVARRRARLVLVNGRLIPERRRRAIFRFIDDPRRVWLPRWRFFQAPNPANTPRVLLNALLGQLIVTAAAVITAAVTPLILYAIPAYAAYAALLLYQRQQQLGSV